MTDQNQDEDLFIPICYTVLYFGPADANVFSCFYTWSSNISIFWRCSRFQHEKKCVNAYLEEMIEEVRLVFLLILVTLYLKNEMNLLF